MQAFARLRDHEEPFRKQSEAASRGSAPRSGQSLKPYSEYASSFGCLPFHVHRPWIVVVARYQAALRQVLFARLKHSKI